MSTYDEFANRNGWGPGQGLQRWVNRRILQSIKKAVPEVRQILEIGCGTGNFAAACVQDGQISYLGVEPNEKLAKFCEGRLPGNSVVRASLPDLPSAFRDSFDVVVAIHVIEHARNGYEAREWVGAMGQACRVGGQIVIVSPDVRDFRAAFWDIDWSHAFPTTCNNLVQILEDLGYRVTMSRLMRIGSLSPILTSAGFFISILIPARILDVISRKFVGRNLGTGLKTALFWGVTFVVAERVQDAN